MTNERFLERYYKQRRVEKWTIELVNYFFSLALLPLLKVNILEGRRRCLFVRPSKVRVEYNMNITILFHLRFAAGTLLFSTLKVSSYTNLFLSECLPHKMLEGGFRRPLQASAHPNQHYLSDITVCAQLNFFLFHPIRVLLVIGTVSSLKWRGRNKICSSSSSWSSNCDRLVSMRFDLRSLNTV